MKIYCDGSANPNPGPGGFGAVVLDNNEKFVYNFYRESSEQTTNNREELKAILYCLKKFGVNIYNMEDEFTQIPIVYSDSAYAINTYTDWMYNWILNHWHKADGSIPENLDIIQEYWHYWHLGYRIELRKVKGHSNIPGNMIADKLARGDFDEIPFWNELFDKEIIEDI